LKNIVFVFLALALLVAAARIWPELFCSRRYVDIRTGRSRLDRVVFVPMYSRVAETPFSQVWKATFGDYPEPVWRLESRIAPLTRARSPGYGYLGAFFWQESVLAAFGTAKFDKWATKYALAQYMYLLERNAPEAGLYAMTLIKLANSHLTSVVTTNDLEEIATVDPTRQRQHASCQRKGVAIGQKGVERGSPISATANRCWPAAALGKGEARFRYPVEASGCL
jgi:hypothetical protein